MSKDTPAKAANVVTVAALFKKQLEKAKQAWTTPGITATSAETDSDDGVVFVREERSSLYFKQKASDRCPDTATLPYGHGRSLKGVSDSGDQKRLSQKLSLRRTERRERLSDSQTPTCSHSESAATGGSRPEKITCCKTTKRVIAESGLEAGDAVERSATMCESTTVCEPTSDLSSEYGALNTRLKDGRKTKRSGKSAHENFGLLFSSASSASYTSCTGLITAQSSDPAMKRSGIDRGSGAEKSKMSLERCSSHCHREVEPLPAEPSASIKESLQSLIKHTDQQNEHAKTKGKLSLKRKKSITARSGSGDKNWSMMKNIRLDVQHEVVSMDSQHSQRTDSVAGEVQNEALTPAASSQDGDTTSEQASSSQGSNGDANKENQYLVPYYLENFREILKTVMEDEFYEQLFNNTDLEHVAAFNSLKEESQKLYIRLFSRKLAWLPVSKIKYPEIGADLTLYFNELVSSALLRSDENLTDLLSVLGTLSAPDLRTLAKSYHLNPSGQQKGHIVQSLVAKSQQNTVAAMFGQKTGSVAHSMLNRAKKLMGHIYRLEEEPRRTFIRVMMLFSLANTSIDEESGNGGQAQLFQMLMVNIGRVVYPSYVVNRQTRVFRHRDDLIRFEEALQLESELLGRTGSGDWTGAFPVFLQVKDQYDKLLADTARIEWDASLPEYLRYYTAGSVLVRLLHRGIEILQRRKDYTAAVSLIRELLSQDVYNLDLHGFWWERLALNLDVHLKQQAQALQAIQDGLSDPAVRTGHRLALYLRAESICNKPKSPHRKRLQDFNHEPLLELPKTLVEGRVLADGVGGRIHQFMMDDSQTGDENGDVTLCNVEQVVMDHYRVNGFPQGVHAEGSIVSTLFSLYFWEIIFMDVVDAFHNPYQTHPLDFYTDAFYHRRKTFIDARLAEIENSSVEDLHRMMTETWEANFNVICAGLNVERLKSIEQLQGLISCMGGRVLARILGRYAYQPRHTRGGFPDLTLWNTDTKQIKICEVKGPGDRLSHKQMLWLDHLLKLGVDAEVCHVKAVGAKKLKRSLPAGD